MIQTALGNDKMLAIKRGLRIKFSMMVKGSTYGPSTVWFVAVEVEVTPLVTIHKLFQKGCK